MPGFLAQREIWIAPETSDDFAVLTDFVDQLVLKRNTGASIDAEEVDQVQEAGSGNFLSKYLLYEML